MLNTFKCSILGSIIIRWEGLFIIGGFYAQPFHYVMEALAFNAHGQGGAGDIPFVADERPLDVFGGEVIKGYFSGLVIWSQEEGLIQMVEGKSFSAYLIAEVFQPQGLPLG